MEADDMLRGGNSVAVLPCFEEVVSEGPIFLQISEHNNCQLHVTHVTWEEQAKVWFLVLEKAQLVFLACKFSFLIFILFIATLCTMH